MAKLTRVTAKVFGGSAGSTQVGVFGSLAAGSPTFTNSPSTVQSLSNWALGWFGGVLGGNSPAIEDLNGFCFVDSYQIAYMLQSGIAEFDASTTYYTNNLAMGSTGTVYQSLIDSNTGNTPVAGSQWAVFPQTTYALGPTTGSFSTLAGTYSQAGSVNIVSNGKPVQLTLVPDGTGNPATVEAIINTGSTANLSLLARFLRDGSSIAVYQFGISTANDSNTAFNFMPGGFTAFDVPSVGSHQYAFQVNSVGSHTTIFVANCKILAKQV